MTRRDVMKSGLAAAVLGAAGTFDWVLPALAQGEVVVPFTDSHQNFNPTPAPDRRLLDTRALNGPFTPKDQFFTTQHYGHPEIDPAAFRLKVSGLVNSSLALSLDDLRKMGNTELIAGFECSGNRRPIQGLIGNGRWTGVPLKTVLDKAGLKADVQEIVFFGGDRGKETVAFRGNNFDVEQQYGRSLPRARALASEPAPFLAYALNGAAHKATVIVLNDGTPIKSVEVKVDEGQWMAAKADPATTAKYGWKLYHFDWANATAGEHTIVSRVTDATGQGQPTEQDLANKKTFLEDNSQHPRKIMI